MTLLTEPRQYTLNGVLESPCDGYTIADLKRMRRSQPTKTQPRIRFWANDAEGNGLRMVEGTIRVSRVDIRQTGGMTEYTVTGNMFPPIYQYLIPDEIADHDMMPINEVQDDVVASEIDFEGAGFKQLGFIDPDGLQIETSTEYERTWGGRTFKTRQETTVEFNAWSVNHEVMERLFR